MGFYVIRGSFRLVSKTTAGHPTGFEPDGDSLQFKPAKPSLLDKLTRLMSPYRLSPIGSTQLRFEGIDALELHFTAGQGGSTHQPRPAADQARDRLVNLANLDPVAYTPPRNIRVKPPAVHDGQPGYILSRSLEVHGRPVAFVYPGHDAPDTDGKVVRLTAEMLRASLNHAMVTSGQAYPLFYDTLFHDLRDELATAATAARQGGLGVWATDRSLTGLQAGSIPQLETGGFLFPKLFRRLAEFFGTGHHAVAQFPAWVAGKQERVWDLDLQNNTHFDTYLKVTNGTVSMTKDPGRLVFVSAKAKERWM